MENLYVDIGAQRMKNSFYQDAILSNCICQFDHFHSLVVSACMFHKEGTQVS